MLLSVELLPQVLGKISGQEFSGQDLRPAPCDS